MNAIYLKSSDTRIRGWYATDSDDPPKCWTWRDCGNGPEVVDSGVFGPFGTKAAAERFIANYLVEVAD